MATGIQISPSSDITVGTTAISNGTEGRVLFQGAGNVVQQDANFTFSSSLKRLTLKAVGTSSTNIPFSVRNSADTRDIIRIQGNESTVLQSGQYASCTFVQDVNEAATLILRTTGNSQAELGNDFNAAPGSTYTGALKLYNWSSALRTRIQAVGTSFWADSSSQVVIGSSTAGARLDVRAQGALSTDLAFRVRNSTDTITTLASNGLGHIETRVNNSFHFKTSVIGSTNTISKGDFGGYENGMVVGHGNTMNPNVNMYIFGNNNSNSFNGNGFIIGYQNTNCSGNIIGAFNTNKGGNTFGNGNTGTSNVFGNNNSISENNGHGGTAFVVGNFLQLPNNIIINDTIYFGVRSSLGAPHISMHHNNLGIGGVIPTLTNYDLNARGVFYAQIGTAPTTLAANTFGMYSADIVAGNAAPHFRTEAGDVVKLYKETTAIGGAGYVDGVDDPIRKDTTMNGYTLEQVVKALQNFGLLA
jgi:hypothetical protein